jgi:hypothetical protein
MYGGIRSSGRIAKREQVNFMALGQSSEQIEVAQGRALMWRVGELRSQYQDLFGVVARHGFRLLFSG